MKDIQVDENGDLRCASCGGKHFQDRRTGTAHVVGFVTVGFGALATKKKLRCKLCGAYNRQGNAQPYTPAPDASVATPTSSYTVEPGSHLDRHSAGMSTKERKRREKATPPPPPSSREGQYLTMKNPGIRPNRGCGR